MLFVFPLSQEIGLQSIYRFEDWALKSAATKCKGKLCLLFTEVLHITLWIRTFNSKTS